MAKPKNDSYASTEELAWFKIENYSGVRGQKTADFADSASTERLYAEFSKLSLEDIPE